MAAIAWTQAVIGWQRLVAPYIVRYLLQKIPTKTVCFFKGDLTL